MINREMATAVFKKWYDDSANGQHIPEGFYTLEEIDVLNNDPSIELESAIYFLAMVRHMQAEVLP